MKQLLAVLCLTLLTGLMASCAHEPMAAAAMKPATGELKPAIVSAKEWGSNPDPIPDSRKQTPAIITIHHAGEIWKAGSDPRAKLVGLQTWGKREKGWADLPYHFLIAPDGETFEGRDINYEPESNTDYSLNGHIGIDVWGNFEEQRIGAEQLTAVVNLCAWLCEKYNIDPDTIAGHRDRAPGQTVCPGKDFYRYVHDGQIIQWTKEKMAGKIPDIKTLPEMEGGPTEVIPGGTL